MFLSSSSSSCLPSSGRTAKGLCVSIFCWPSGYSNVVPAACDRMSPKSFQQFQAAFSASQAQCVPQPFNNASMMPLVNLSSIDFNIPLNSLHFCPIIANINYIICMFIGFYIPPCSAFQWAKQTFQKNGFSEASISTYISSCCGLNTSE